MPPRSLRDRFAGKAQVVFETDEGVEDEEDIPWSIETFPFPDKKRFGKRKGVEYLTATGRLYWRSDRRLAFRAGIEYPADIADQLMTEEELLS